SVAGGDEIAAERGAGRREDEGIGVGEQRRGQCSRCRDPDDVYSCALKSCGELGCARLGERDQCGGHDPDPRGTTDSAAPSVTAARISAISARSTMTSTAALRCASMPSLSGTDATTTSAARMRGASSSPESAITGEYQSSTGVPTPRCAGRATLLSMTMLVVRPLCASAVAIAG